MIIPWITKTQYYSLQNTLFKVVNEAWIKEQNSLSSFVDSQPLFVSGDGRCDSPGHNAKYMTYSLLDQKVGKVITISLTQVTEVGGCSNNMEKLGLIKVLTELDKKNMTVQQLTTDRHLQIGKYIREERVDIDHQFDVWHFSKSVKSKLLAIGKKKSCKEIQPWIKSIINHLWWCCATCNENEKLLKEKWLSIVFHIQNKHNWTGHEFYHECSHGELDDREWLSPTSVAFSELQTVVFDRRLLNDMVFLTKYSHTGVIEVYHSLLNKWAPKSNHFSMKGMEARCKLAALDFNQGSNLPQSITKKGEKRFNVTFSKLSRNWVAKPIKEKKNLQYFTELVDESIYAIIEKKSFHPEVTTKSIPKNIASTPKPNKKDVIEKQLSRFKSY